MMAGPAGSPAVAWTGRLLQVLAFAAAAPATLPLCIAVAACSDWRASSRAALIYSSKLQLTPGWWL